MRNIVTRVMSRVWIKRKTSKRLFLAVPIPLQWSEALSSLQESVKSRHIMGAVPTRWTERDSLHMAVRFIGNVDERCIPSLVTTIRRLLREVRPFELPFESAHVATVDDPKMIWATFRNVKPFQQVVTRSTRRIAKFLFKECNGTVMHNGHDVIPHVTLARLNGTVSFSADVPGNMLFPKALPVSSLVLYESRTFSTGSVYHTIATFPLNDIRI